MGGAHPRWYGQVIHFIAALIRRITGLLTAMFGVAGTLLNVSQRAQNLGKVWVNFLFRERQCL